MAEEREDGLGRLGKWLAGGFAFITTVFTALGIAAGDIDRILRNQPGEAIAWLFLVGIGIASGLIVGYTQSSAEGNRGVLRGWALIFSVLATGLLVLAVVWSSLPGPVERMQWWRWIILVLAVAAVLVMSLGLISSGVRTKLDEAGADVSYWLVIGLVAAGAIAWCAVVIGSWRSVLVTGGLVLLLAGLLRVVWPPTFHIRAAALGVGFVAFFVGLGGFFSLSVENTSAKDRPAIVVTLADGENAITLNATVQATGLSIDEHILVTVEGLNRAERLAAERAGRERDTSPELIGDSAQTLYLSRTGPDQTGEVNLDLTLPVSPGLYERLRVSAFLASVGSEDLLGEVERLNQREAIEAARRATFDADNGVGIELTEDEVARRAEYDASNDDLDDDERSRREEVDRLAYEESVGAVEMQRRLEFDQKLNSDRSTVTGRLQQELLRDVRCSASRQAYGCVILLLPEVPSRPLLTARPVRADDTWSIDVTLEVAALSADDVVQLWIFGRLPERIAYEEQLYRASLPPNQTGSFRADLDIPLGATDIEAVCVVAELLRGGRGQTARRYGPGTDCLSPTNRVSAVALELDTDAPPPTVATEMTSAPTTVATETTPAPTTGGD